MAEFVFIQPHFDDVALSCGATVAALAEAGRPTIVTVFAGEPGRELSDFARFQHDRWSVDGATVTTTRRLEDRAAARELGATVDVVWLDHLDAIYRSAEYASDDALFGEPVDEDLGLIDRIVEDLDLLGDRFVAPLGIGKHVDHELVFRAACRLGKLGNEVWFYADLPYALDEDAYRSRLAVLGGPEPCAREVGDEQFSQRWRAIECYVSQLPVIFRNLENPREEFREFGRSPGGEGSVELFWPLEQVEGRQS